ncbi:MAG: domain S-box protein [Fibrobacteres bacterium]|nr:domain S-box protein [Fibrobacterota bacterium]
MESLPLGNKVSTLPVDFPRRLLEGLDEGVLAVDPEGTILFCNPRFAAMLSSLPEDLLGLGLIRFLGPPDQKAFASLLRDPGEGTFRREVRMVRKDGSEVPAFLSAKPARLGGQKAYCLAAVDLSEMRRAESVSRITEEQSRQSQKMEAIGRLASGVAHDFNNFLTAINGFSAFLLDMVEEESPLRPGLLEISRAGDRAASLTKQLLAFGRKRALAPQPVDVNGVVSEMHRMLRSLIGEDVELVLGLDPSAGSVLFNPGQMEQIILNLSLNARDAMPKGGRLAVETLNVALDPAFREVPPPEEAGAPFVRIRFADNGMGMDAEVRDRLFEPFFTTKKSGRGTGLGLSTVYSIVKQCGGHITVESEPGSGTAFQVYLPRTRTRTKGKRPLQADHQPPQYRGAETILVAEDEYSVRKLIRNLLSGNGYLVLEASDGLEALAVIREYQGPIHMLLTDVVMPNLNGRLLAEEVGRLRPDIRVLYMSGYSGDSVVRCGIMEGENPFLAKPFTPQALAKKVRERLEMPAVKQA